METSNFFFEATALQQWHAVFKKSSIYILLEVRINHAIYVALNRATYNFGRRIPHKQAEGFMECDLGCQHE